MLSYLSTSSRRLLLRLTVVVSPPPGPPIRPRSDPILNPPCCRRRLHNNNNNNNRMERAVVRCVPGESKLTLSFALDGSNKHMLRDTTEELGKLLARIVHNLAKGQGKAVKKSKKSKERHQQQRAEEEEEEARPPAVRLFYGDGEPVPEATLNSAAWQDGAVLQVGEVRYAVQRNPPAFTAAELPASLLAGFPVCPRLEVEFGRLEQCQFTWYKESRPDASAGTAGDGGGDVWREAGLERVYVPSNLDIGLRLRLRCTPKDGERRGPDKELVSAAPVEAGPGACTFDNRHVYTLKGPEEEARALRVVSYNILADVYAQTELSKTVLYPYCAPYALEADYRQNLIKKELAGYNADVVCLQEVDKGVFSDSLCPALDAFGFDGLFKLKAKQHEGLSTFYRRSKLRLLSRHDIILSESLTSDPLYSDMLEKISTNPVLKDKILQRSTALQVSVFEVLKEPSRKICVANTHLYWHPKGGNVRLVQISVALKHLNHVISEVAPGAALILSGDFNSTPNSGLFSLLTQGVIADSHPDWSSGGPEEACPQTVSSPFCPLLSACGEPAYTNYVGGFHGCLDYIFTEPDRMEVDQVIPLPSHEEVTTYQALPSVSHPSDHIALVCDLRWRT